MAEVGEGIGYYAVAAPPALGPLFLPATFVLIYAQAVTSKVARDEDARLALGLGLRCGIWLGELGD